jgi:hypothetical protein
MMVIQTKTILRKRSLEEMRRYFLKESNYGAKYLTWEISGASEFW